MSPVSTVTFGPLARECWRPRDQDALKLKLELGLVCPSLALASSSSIASFCVTLRALDVCCVHGWQRDLLDQHSFFCPLNLEQTERDKLSACLARNARRANKQLIFAACEWPSVAEASTVFV